MSNQLQRMREALETILHGSFDPEMTAVEAIREFERIARAALAEPSVCKWRHAGRAIYTCQSHEGVMDGVMWDFCPWCGRPLVVEEVVDE